MAIKKFKELKQLSKDELVTKIRDAEADLFKARMNKATGQLENKTSIWKMRKEIARMKMLRGDV